MSDPEDWFDDDSVTFDQAMERFEELRPEATIDPRYHAYFWTDHGDMGYGLKLSRDEPFGEDTPLFLEMNCLSHDPPCAEPVRVPAVGQRTYERRREQD
jgi:hypothetical protein